MRRHSITVVAGLIAFAAPSIATAQTDGTLDAMFAGARCHEGGLRPARNQLP